MALLSLVSVKGYSPIQSYRLLPVWASTTSSMS